MQMQDQAIGAADKLHSPMVLRSWQHLRDTQPDLKPLDVLPIQPSGVTYTMAQELTWLDDQHFAVGRWDGSLSIFRFTQSATQGPLISKAVTTPSSEGVQMITLLMPGAFATSNDDRSMIVWQSSTGTWGDLAQSELLRFDPELGVANSGASFVCGGVVNFVVGHANGYLSLWRVEKEGTFLQVCTVDVRSDKPINPWGLHNVRGIGLIAVDGDVGYVVSGSEDGDLCVVRVPDGIVLSRTIYNPLAQRGINSLATHGGDLLVANCAVGAEDCNLWVYSIDRSTWAIDRRGGVRLVVDPSLAQAFNFDVIWGAYGDQRCWYCATEEGYLWMGGVDPDAGIHIIGRQVVTAKLGAAIGMSEQKGLAFVAYDLYEFDARK